MSKRAESAKLAETFDPGTLGTDEFGVDSRFSLEHAIGVTLTGEQEVTAELGVARSDTSRYVSDTSQLTWDVSQRDGGVFPR